MIMRFILTASGTAGMLTRLNLKDFCCFLGWFLLYSSHAIYWSRATQRGGFRNKRRSDPHYHPQTTRLQYLLAEAIQVYLGRKGLRYARCEEIMGALTGAQHEFYREIMGPYEAMKAEENGHVYDRNELLDGLDQY